MMLGYILSSLQYLASASVVTGKMLHSDSQISYVVLGPLLLDKIKSHQNLNVYAKGKVKRKTLKPAKASSPLNGHLNM